jgi:hypothetical protein
MCHYPRDCLPGFDTFAMTVRFIAVHHAQKQVVIAIKGTSSLSDVLTGIIAKAVPHEECPGLRCHEGIHVAAIASQG